MKDVTLDVPVKIDGLQPSDPRLSILSDAFRSWFKTADVSLSEISGGFSGSGVFKVDLKNLDPSNIPSGIYVLKLSKSSSFNDLRDEYLVHNEAIAQSPEFSEAHIPLLHLVYRCEQSRYYTMLFEVAGRSLSQFSTSTGAHSSSILSNADSLVPTLLNAWCEKEFGELTGTADLLGDICGYRLREADAPDFHKFVGEYCSGRVFSRYGEVLVNPINFLDILRGAVDEISPLMGLIHGDLHGGNILFHRFDPENQPFFVIDFALSRKSLIGFDLSYLELHCALEHLGRSDVAPLLAALKASDTKLRSSRVSPDAHWIVSMFKALRKAQELWRADNFPNRVDDFDRQILLSRVAVGINWANKNISNEWNSLAICYAGWAARQYLEIHLPEEWAQVSGFTGTESSNSELNKEIWEEIYLQLNEFDSRKGKYILVVEGLVDQVNLAALGQLPWSIVIDLDPNSDVEGVLKHAEPNISTRRAMHLFTSEIPDFDPQRGTAWMLAGGWTAKRDFYPDFFEWRWKKLPVIRDAVRRLEENTRPETIYCVILTGKTLDQDAPTSRVDSIIKDIDEACQGRAKFFAVGTKQVTERASSIEKFPIPSLEFVEQLARVYGVKTKRVESSLPASDDRIVSVPPDRLRLLEENLTILHSSVITTQPDESEETSEFWRGRPPSWSEISNEIDIDRDIVVDITLEALKWLSAHRNHTIVIEHLPGSGATTVSRRVAWNIRNDYPCVLIHTHSEAVGERIRDIFQLTESPVFVVAENSTVTEAEREELHRYLVKNNVRATVLYLRRSFGPSKDRSFSTVGYLTEAEIPKFRDTYKELTDERYRKEQIARISNNQTLERYRLPFFYGLIAFERNFLGLESYVESNMGEVNRSVRKILEHIALASIYSNSGIPKSIVSTLSGVNPSMSLQMPDLVGEGPASLLIEYGGNIRFLHQLIAEEVIEHFRKGISENWRLDLKSYSIDFIEDIVGAAGEIASAPLLRQIFIDRSGSIDGVEDREDFSPIIESLDSIDEGLGHSVLAKLTEESPNESHFWSHLGRHQVYRMRRDYDKAEEYLQKAIGLSSYDPTHHHTLGLVIRSRLRNDLRNLPRTATVSDVFESIDPLFSDAADAFTESRGLSPDNVYGYITHIQLITQTLKRLMSAAAVDTIVLAAGDDNTVALWIAEKLAEAEELLRGATNLYSTLEPSSDYLVRRKAEMSELYGDIDQVIELWELANARGVGANSRSRSALANAYLARANRKWREMPSLEIQRISELMTVNLRDTGRRSDDYLLWFMAFSSTPKFDYDKAISNISLWLRRFPTWEAHYLQYMLRFMLWFEGRTQDTDEYKNDLAECARLSHTIRTRSPIWFGRGIGICPIVHESDLGGWDRELNFWRDPKYLRRVNGIIDRIDGPTSGSIKIDGKISVFFSPGRDFSVYRSINEKVNFYIGFSPSGPRAWDIKTGFVKDGHRGLSAEVPKGSVLFDDETGKPEGAISTVEVDELAYNRAFKFGVDYIYARARLGLGTNSVELASRIEAVTRVRLEPGEKGFDRLLSNLRDAGVSVSGQSISEMQFRFVIENEEIIEATESIEHSRLFGKVKFYNAEKRFGFVFGEDGVDYYFKTASVLPEFRNEIIGANPLVSFYQSSSPRGKTAQGIAIVTGLVVSDEFEIPEDEFQGELIRYIFEQVDEDGTGSLTLSKLVHSINKKYLSSRPLEEILDAKNLSAFVRSVEGIHVFGRHPNLFVGRSRQPVIGRVPLAQSVHELNSEGGVDEELTTELFEAWLTEYLAGPTKPESGVLLKTVAKAASKRFAIAGNVPHAFGAKSMRALIQPLPGFKVQGVNPKQKVVIEAQSDREDASLRNPRQGDNEELTTELFEAWLTEYLAGPTKPESGVLLKTVAKAASKRFAIAGNVPHAFGAKSMRALIQPLPGFKVQGVNPKQKVVIEAQSDREDASLRNPRQGDNEELTTELFEAWLTEYLAGPTKPESGVLLKTVAKAASKRFAIAGNVPHAFGAKSMRALIQPLPGFKVQGVHPKQKVVIEAQSDREDAPLRNPRQEDNE